MIPATEPYSSIEMIIQINATIRPATDTGNLSPYPTVVIVEVAHQMPSSIPSKYLFGNWSAFFFLSKNQTICPNIIVKMITWHIELIMSGINNASNNVNDACFRLTFTSRPTVDVSVGVANIAQQACWGVTKLSCDLSTRSLQGRILSEDVTFLQFDRSALWVIDANVKSHAFSFVVAYNALCTSGTFLLCRTILHFASGEAEYLRKSQSGSNSHTF